MLKEFVHFKTNLMELVQGNVFSILRVPGQTPAKPEKIFHPTSVLLP
jgi:hypothetical protein